MSRKNIENVYPLSPLQEGMLFHTLYAEGEGAYVTQFDWAVRGSFDVDAFQRAFQEVVNRHAILRTFFTWEGLERPIQVVRKRAKLTVDLQDLRELSPAEQAERLRAFADDDRARGFDLTKAPAMRVTVFRLGDEHHRCFLSIHHIVIDGWSKSILIREVLSFYHAYAAGRDLSLPVPTPYADFIAWIGKQDPAKAEGFFRQLLAGFSAPTPFGVDLPEGAGAGEGFEDQGFSLSPQESQEVSAFARAQGLTVNTVVQGTFAILLSRYSGEEDVLFGATVSGRSAPITGIDRMVGLFINAVPVRARLHADEPVSAFLAALQVQQADIRELEHTPLVTVQGFSEVPRGTPLFESLVVFENFPVEESVTLEPAREGFAQAGKEASRPASMGDSRVREHSNYPLTLMAAIGKQFAVQVSFDRRRFDPDTIRRMLRHFQNLLKAILRAPGAPLGALSLLGEDERKTLVHDWNATDFPYPDTATLHGLFEARVAQAPDAPALLSEGREISYRALNEEANRLAHHLRALGAGRDTQVGICVERSPSMVVALLAVLKSGASYVPIDPAYPRERIALMIEISRLPILVTQTRIEGSLPVRGLQVVCLDQEDGPLASSATTNPDVPVGPWDIAYVMYTSGSTGIPKGVSGTHTGAINRFAWMWRTFPFQPGELSCQKTTLSFVDSIWEIFGPLLAGVPALLIADEVLKDTGRFIEALGEHRVTRLVLVPSLLRAMLDTHADLDKRLPALKWWTTSGEALPSELGKRFVAELPGRVLLNLYGSTEVSADATYHVVEAGAVGARIPIGKPMDNTQVYLLDARRELLPIGVTGELYVGGAGVARGYLHRPDLTAERFLPDPFRPGPRALLFKTGDLGRYLPNGDIEYLGRADYQVKVRGFRIELGEVESAISQHPAVKQVVVTARDYGQGDLRILAYVIPEGNAPSVADLRAFVKERLPEYMVPSAFLVLDRLPLTPSGKVDRKALPLPERTAGAEQVYVSPRGPTEEALAGIFAEVLKIPVEQVGAHDGFFELGGHSLLATQTVSRIRGAFGVELPLRSLFEAPTPAELGKRVDEAIRGAQGLVLPPLVREEATGPRPLSFAQERLWFLDQLTPGDSSYNIPLAMQLGGSLDIGALGKAFSELCRRHEALRTTFTTVEGKPVQLIHEAMDIPLPVTSLTFLPETERPLAAQKVAAEEVARPFNLGEGPLLRVRLIELTEGVHRLVLTIHHIVSDGWSMGILQREVATLYEAFRKGEPSPLPELPVHYADYAAWQRGWLSGEVLDKQLGYWTEALRGAPQAIDLPTDHPRPQSPSHRGGRRAFALSPELSASLHALARKENVTLFMLLLGAFDVLLHRHTGQDDIVVGSPIAGRTAAATEGMIGFFVNTLVLRARFAEEITFSGLLAEVREACLGAYAHQDVPFERLVRELAPERDMSRTPLFQVMFIHQNAARDSAPREGAPREPGTGKRRGVTVEDTTAKFDLTLTMVEGQRTIAGYFEYALDLFDAATADRLATHLVALLEGITRAPGAPVQALPMLAEEERKTLLVDWNATDADYPRDATLHGLFEARAARTPDDIALLFEGKEIAYRSLNEEANRLAHHLRSLGAGKGSQVGICVQRSPAMVVALLAVLKTGAAYVPLDPAYPVDRLALMIEISHLRVLVTQERLLDLLPAQGIERVCLDRVEGPLAALSSENPAVPVDPWDIAYVMYTSGSTGAPKGVSGTHTGMVNRFTWMWSKYPFQAGEICCQKTTLSFGDSIWEIFGPLLQGVPAVLIPDEVLKDTRRFVDALADNRVSRLVLVPSLLRAMLDTHEGLGARLPLLKTWTTSGEALPAELCRRFLAEMPGRTLLNLYGSSEVSADATCYVPESPAAFGARVPIGKPIANVRVYVLDARKEPVPLGVSGEIYVGGVGIARGYLHRPDLSAQRFLPDPFRPGPRALLFKTGDVGRYLGNGDIEYLGRADLQVKVRGFRIELGEVEGAIAQHPAVKQVVVSARDYGDADRRLIAYVVKGDGTPTPAQLRSFVKEQLPEYMVPSVFVFLDKLPLTPSGKVDRKALPAPERVAGAERIHVAARGPTEEALVGIFAEVLKIPPESVGVHDGFFELGGHSLLATQAISRIRGALGAELLLRTLFEAPTPAELGKRVDEALRGGKTPALPPLERDATSGPRELSFAQERLWFLDQLTPGDTSYTIPLGMQLGGMVDTAALALALGEVLRRHEALRTVFEAVDGKPVQIIHPPSPVPLPFTSLTSLPEGERYEAARRLSTEESNRPFDLARGPLFRARLIELDEGLHLLLLTMHHIVSDGWSLGVLQRELSVIYEAFRKDEPSPLAELPVQYADYAAWQRRWLSGEALEQQLGYWREALRGAPQALDLPADRPRPAIPSYRGGRRAFSLSPEVSQALFSLAQRENVTLFMLLLAAFDLLLHRYTGQDDIVVGSPIAGRTNAATEGLIGFFVNTLVLRARFAEEASFSRLLAEVRESCLGAYAHQDVPFERLVAELAPERDTSRTPLFQVMFLLQNALKENVAREGASPTAGARRGVTVESGTTKFDLTLIMIEGRKTIAGAFEYALDLFDAATVDRMVGHFQTLLEGIAQAPGVPVGDLPLLPPAEHELLARWNATEMDFPREAGLHELVEAQIERTPDAVAIVDGTTRISYRELERRSNQLANLLRKRGVGPDVLVGVCVRRSASMVIALLAILKAGGAYVPLDPAYPTARLGQILEDAAARVVLSESAVEGVLPAQHGAELLLVDRDAALFAAESDARPSRLAGPSDLAYVLFTSGSTGRPKGVAIEHHSAVCLIAWAMGVYGPEDRAGVLLGTSICFDLSVFELFLPLASGGKLIVAENALALPSLPAAGEVTLVNTVPTAIAELMRTGGVPASVRVVCLAGEPLAASLVAQVYAQATIERVYNLYGPTEDTTYSTFTLVPNGAPVTVGRPIGNGTAYLLDARQRPVPIGVPGEIYLGGEGLARGYLGRPDLTAERFVADPFHPGQRLYRTSDLGRFRLDGEIEYLGRIDHQVKVRGFRIELGEVELVVRKHASVREVVVVAREDTPGNKRLVAYVVAADGARAEVGELRAFVAERLPDFMVPQVFVVLEKLPLTANGKIDRKALPAPELGDSLVRAYVAPRDPVEEALVGMFADVLQLPADAVGVHHGFFELGGHSLLATQVISRIRSAFGVDLLLRVLFEAPTPAALAGRVEEAIRGGQGLALPPLERAAHAGSMRPLSFAQERLWFLDQLTPGDASYNMPLSMQLLGTIDLGALRRAFTELGRRHETLRTTFTAVDGKPHAEIHDELDVELPVQSLASWPESARLEAARREAAVEAARPFDLEQGPLVRARVLEINASSYVLLLTMHHIVSDGWSMGILQREVAVLYEAFRTGKPSPLSDLPVQYADFAAWQRSWLDGEVLDQQLVYWKESLRGAPHALELPTDRPRPPLPSHRGANRGFVLSPELSQALTALARKQNVTLFMLLLAAFDVLLHRYSGQGDIVVGSPIAGRTAAATEGLIGFFVNTMVLRARFDDDATFTRLLAEVRESCLGAYTHQDVPFERLVREISPERDTSRTPLFQVMFVLQNAPREAPSTGGQQRRGLGAELGTAKFDLTLSMLEGRGRLAGSFEYASDLFDASTIDRLIAHFENLLTGIVARPEAKVAALPLLGEIERRALLVDGNQTDTPFDRGATIHALVEAQVDRTPDAIAVRCGGEQLSYRELDARSNRLARHLEKHGVGPGSMVAVCLERSVETVVGVLGVLKAGGAYVALDPAHPPERLAFAMEDCGAPLLLTQEKLSAWLAPVKAKQIRLDADWAAIEGEGEARVVSAARAEDLAYVIYTSGSTGKPKGVLLSHQGLCNLSLWHRRTYGLGSVDRCTHLAAPGFDASVWEIWPALISGATLLVPDDATRASPSALAAFLVAERVTVSFLPTPLAEAVLAEPWPSGGALRALLTGGDRLRRRPPAGLPFRLFNHYGPTEYTVVTTVAEIAPEGPEPPPIGRPIDNTQVFVLDAALEPVPIGVPGELFIGGVGLARGYLNQPALTAARFIESPFGGPGDRLYRTGDRVRRRADGDLEFLGRADDQVKIRGFRIELGEIEASLAAHPSVHEAVVVVREDTPGDARLVAYWVCSGEPGPTLDELRGFLQQTLPSYMIPSAFVRLDALPLTPNGKIDRRALPAPAAGDLREGKGPTLPRDDVEAQLVNIWRRVLKTPNVGVRDSFFDLGGHSMLAVQMVAEIKKSMGKEIPLIALFSARTIEQLAGLLRDEGEERKWSALVPVRAEGSLRPFFMISRPNVNALGYVALGRHLDPERPLYVLQYQYPEERVLGRPYTREEYVEWSAKYVELMRSVQPEGPYLLGGMCEGAIIAFAMAQSLEADGQEIALLAMLDAWPEENTRDPFLNDIVHYEGSIRRFFRRVQGKNVGYFLGQLKSALVHFVKNPTLLKSVKPTRAPAPAQTGAPSAPSADDLWLMRHFPGPDFVPPKVRCDITVFRVKKQPYWRIRDQRLGWGTRSEGEVEAHMIAGDHDTFMREEHVAVLAEKLEACIAKVEAAMPELTRGKKR